MTDPAQRGLGHVKCLIVDDLDENLLALAALLRDDEVEVLQARSGAQALELLLLHDVALALIDVQMPEMDGFELAELMRGSERTRRVPIIFVTAGARDPQRIFRGYESGAVDFLFKPIETHILKSKAAVFFRLHRQAGQLARQLDERTETLKLHEIFTGIRPIEGKTSIDVMRGHITIEPQRPTLLRPDLPDRLERIVLSCLAKSPDRRPPTANDLYGALMRVAI